MQVDQDLLPLLQRSSSDCLSWFGRASLHIPELARALEFLKQACALVDQIELKNITQCSKELKQIISKYLGHTRHLSKNSCEKIAVRIQILDAWMETELQRFYHIEPLLDIIELLAEKLIALCINATENGTKLFRTAQSCMRTKMVLFVERMENPIERAQRLFPLAMQDQVGLIESDWWWRQLSNADRDAVLGLIESELSSLSDMQPSESPSWRSFDKRWIRQRLKSLLQQLNQPALLAELLRKSAIDGNEAAQAIKAIRMANQSREAIAQAEQWMRTLPYHQGLALELFDLYCEDGCDQDAIHLAIKQFTHGYESKWIEKLEFFGTKEAFEQLKLLKRTC